MKILVVHGSMRKGETYALVKEITDRLAKKPDAELREISVAELNLPLCASCHNCFTRGEEYCPHYDIMRGVETAISECDGIILSGPTYVWAVNAAMKNLLDHLAYLFHRPAHFGKIGMAVSTSAGAGEKGVAKYLKTVLGQWGVNGAAVVTRNLRERALVSNEKAEAAFDAASERFYGLMAAKKPIAPSIKAITVHNAFRAMSLGKFASGERDAQFWRREGYNNRPYPVYAGWKSIYGALIFNVVRLATAALGRGAANDK